MDDGLVGYDDDGTDSSLLYCLRSKKRVISVEKQVLGSGSLGVTVRASWQKNKYDKDTSIQVVVKLITKSMCCELGLSYSSICDCLMYEAWAIMHVDTKLSKRCLVKVHGVAVGKMPLFLSTLLHCHRQEQAVAIVTNFEYCEKWKGGLMKSYRSLEAMLYFSQKEEVERREKLANLKESSNRKKKSDIPISSLEALYSVFNRLKASVVQITRTALLAMPSTNLSISVNNAQEMPKNSRRGLVREGNVSSRSSSNFYGTHKTDPDEVEAEEELQPVLPLIDRVNILRRYCVFKLVVS